MKNLFLIILIACINYLQVNAQHITTDSSSNCITENEPIKSKRTIIRNEYSKTDSLGNTLILASPASIREMILLNDSTRETDGSPKQSLARSGCTPLNMAQVVTLEGFYRLSEGFFNHALDSASYHRLYSQTLQYTIDLLSEQIDLEDAKTEQIKAETERLKIEVEKQKLELERLKIEKGIFIPEQREILSNPMEGDKTKK